MALLRDAPSYTILILRSLFHLLLVHSTGARTSPELQSGFLNDVQIAGIESRLRLTPRQAEYWPAVAVALRDVGRKYFQPRQRRPRKIDVNSAEVQRLIETATPLILLLGEDQKREVRQLVRLIGLETVASRI